MAHIGFIPNRESYQKFLNDTVSHKRGFFILAPSGAGKTHFVKNQKEKNWIDGDFLWVASGAHPDTRWWTEGLEKIKEVDSRSDIVTEEAKKLGLWIVGASNNHLVPDAVVLPPWDKNVSYIKYREENNYDGGLKSDQLEQLKNHRTEIQENAEKNNVPIFESMEEATSYLEKQYFNN